MFQDENAYTVTSQIVDMCALTNVEVKPTSNFAVKSEALTEIAYQRQPGHDFNVLNAENEPARVAGLVVNRGLSQKAAFLPSHLNGAPQLSVPGSAVVPTC
jgi:hypothetical protein